MRNRGSGNGAHTGLIVNGSQTVLYDPAGTFSLPSVPERNDVLYGISPAVKDVYERYHARSSYYVVEQRLPISRMLADRVIARMEAEGPSAKARCTVHSSAILRSFPEFAHLPQTMWPNRLMEAFGRLPGITEREVYEDDVGQNLVIAPG